MKKSPTAPRKQAASYSLGLDYGTESARALLVDTRSGEELTTCVFRYPTGTRGVILSKDPNLARQNPADYLAAAEFLLRRTLSLAKKHVKGFSTARIVGIGVDTTGSTPLPVDADGRALGMNPRFAKDPAAMAWLWKDHTSTSEAREISERAREHRPHMIARCGNTYSSEWFFSKILRCARTSPKVFNAAHLWVECADWIPAMLTGTEHPDTLQIGVCAAGHKAMFAQDWRGYPDAEFLAMLHPGLGALRSHLRGRALTIDQPVGGLSPQWAARTGMPAGIPVAAGAFDAHLGAIGSGIEPGTLVKIMGTSTCDIAVAPRTDRFPEIPGLCGIVDGSVVPRMLGFEAGQSAVGDIFNWLVDVVKPGGGTHESLSKEAAKIAPGSSGLLALDWNNGNRTVLVDQLLTGLLIGQTLYTAPAEVYRALIEATAFGALTIISRFEEFGVKIDRIINCGGIAQKNPLVMQVYADVTNRTMYVSRSAQTCALGAAIAGAVVGGAHATVAGAQRAMTGVKPKSYKPNPKAHAVYSELYPLYRALHDAFGTPTPSTLGHVMKRLIEIRSRTRG
ncbi:MAG: ribulokinase [Phycisphaerae bacterium]|nr:ribulokinase [Phycisphaerae bacterium]